MIIQTQTAARYLQPMQAIVMDDGKKVRVRSTRPASTVNMFGEHDVRVDLVGEDFILVLGADQAVTVLKRVSA